MSEQRRVDVAVIGAGIVGLAFAWEAARRHQTVVLFDRHRRVQGASVRNFGMVWPIGQMPGEDYARALKSRQRWLELGKQAGIWVQECGSVHAAYEADEDAVLREFAESAPHHGITCEYWTAREALQRVPALNPNGLHSVLYSPTELVVDPPVALQRIPLYLAERYGVTLRLGSTVISVAMPEVRTADGESWHADRVFVCSGADFETLFPEVYATSGLQRCKLQMLKTVPQPDGFRIGPHIAGGLTLCHYRAFQLCSTLAALKKRVNETLADYVRYGIHVMASQNERGEVIIGDSHEYDDGISPFDKSEIDGLILSYLRRLVRLLDWRIAAHWHGVYAKHPHQACYMAQPQPGCRIIASPGGAGMTLAFGIAADWWEANTA